MALLAVGAITIVATRSDRARNALLFVVAVAAAVIAGWVAAGQSLAAFPAYVSHSLELTSGYSTAMGVEESGREWEYVGVLIAIGLLVLLGLRATDGWPRAQRVAVAAIGGAIAFVSFKHGFVRHDGHSLQFFATALVAALALAPAPVHRRETLAVLAALFVLVLGASRIHPSFFNPMQSAKRSLAQAEILTADGGRAEISAAQAGLRAAYPLDNETFALLRGRTVHVAPHDTAVAWAYGLDWRPLPIFQSYAAYTEELDRLNARFLASPDAPARILRTLGAIDGRHPTLEAPSSTVEMLCRYVEIHAAAQWQVLARTDGRCGDIELLQTVNASYGHEIRVPAADPGTLMLARVQGIAPSGVGSLASFAFKLPRRTITLNGAPALSYRLVPQTASGLMVLQSPAEADYTGLLRVSPDAKSFSITRRELPWERDELRVDFYALPIEGHGSAASTAVP